MASCRHAYSITTTSIGRHNQCVYCGVVALAQGKGVAKPMDPPVPCDHKYMDVTTLGNSMRKYRCIFCGGKKEEPMAALFTPKFASVYSTAPMSDQSPMYASTGDYSDMDVDPGVSYAALAAKLADLEVQLADQKATLDAPAIPPMSHHREIDL